MAETNPVAVGSTAIAEQSPGELGEEQVDDLIPPADAASAVPAPYWRRLRLAGLLVLGFFLVGLGVFSTLLYQRFVLSSDFATYSQAWTLIGQGHLDPLDTLRGFPFVRSQFELIIWPLALVHLAVRDSIVLLWIQDVAIAATGLVTYLWVLEHLEQKRVKPSPATLIAAAVLLVIVVDAGAWLTVSFDFHMEPIATCFLVLGGREFWRGRQRRAFVFVAVVLLCGGFAAVMVIGLGVSALLAGPATRRAGLVLVAVGLAWIGLISLLHANEGSELPDYAYLAGRTTLPAGGVVLILTGIVSHPGRALHTIATRLPNIWKHLRGVGILGVASAWGFGVPVVVMVVTALDSHSNFSNSAFQNFAVLPFVLLGTVMVLVWAAEHLPWGRTAAVVVSLLVLAEAVAYGCLQDPVTVRQTLSVVPAGAVSALDKTLSKTPPDAEVVATIAVGGRFSGRKYCYRVVPHLDLPVHARTVVFVFSTHHLELISPAGLRRAITYVRDDLHARVLADADGIWTFLWHPPAAMSTVSVPTTAPAE